MSDERRGGMFLILGDTFRVLHSREELTETLSGLRRTNPGKVFHGWAENPDGVKQFGERTFKRIKEDA
jgi:hypothetical protein